MRRVRDRGFRSQKSSLARMWDFRVDPRSWLIDQPADQKSLFRVGVDNEFSPVPYFRCHRDSRNFTQPRR